MEARFSASVQTGPGAYPASYTTGNGSFPGVKRPGRGVDHPPTSSVEVKEKAELHLYSLYGLEVRHPRCVGSITKNIVYYTYSQTQLYFTY